MTFNEKIQCLNEKISNAKTIVFFTGAGISTESGIRDFRSANGIWSTSPEELCHVRTLRFKPRIFFDFYRKSFDCRKYEPNIAHKRIAELEKTGKTITVVTQNVDSLHQKAGSTVVHEIHGTTAKNHCVECQHEFDEDFIFDSKEVIPTCPYCDGQVRPNIICYGESLPWREFHDGSNAIANADLVIVCGTSLKVYPAASMLYRVPYNNLVIINRDATSFDKDAELVFNESLGEVFSKVKVNERNEKNDKIERT